MSTSTRGRHGHRPAEPAHPPDEHTRYYARMVVAPEDLTRDQAYQTGKRRYWNLRLHGWGIVRGLECSLPTAAQRQGFDASDLLIHVSAGDALDPAGKEISAGRDAMVNIGLVDDRGLCIVEEGEDANPATPGSKLSPPGEKCFLAIRSAEKLVRFVRSPLAPKPGGSDACEATLIQDTYEFKILPGGSGDAAGAASASGWVVLATILDFGKSTMRVAPDDRACYPIDPPRPADEAPDNFVEALARGNLAGAESHVQRWKCDIARGIRRLLEPAGLRRLEQHGPHADLDDIPAKDLMPSEADPIGSERLDEFLVRAESPFLSGRPISVQCLARMTRAAFRDRVRFIFRVDEIPDEPIDHAHREAVLLSAVVRQWPSPTFEGMLTGGDEPACR